MCNLLLVFAKLFFVKLINRSCSETHQLTIHRAVALIKPFSQFNITIRSNKHIFGHHINKLLSIAESEGSIISAVFIEGAKSLFHLLLDAIEVSDIPIHHGKNVTLHHRFCFYASLQPSFTTLTLPVVGSLIYGITHSQLVCEIKDSFINRCQISHPNSPPPLLPTLYTPPACAQLRHTPGRPGASAPILARQGQNSSRTATWRARSRGRLR